MNRSANGMGSITLRADGRWEGRATLPSHGGKRRRKCVYGKTEEEVVAKLRRLLGDLERGRLPEDKKLTLGRYLEHWLEHTVAPAVRPSTLSGYTVNVRRHIVPALGSIPLAKLGPPAVRGLLATKRDEGLKPRTIQYIHAVLRAALNDALADELIHRNVAALVDGPTVRHSPVEPLSPEQVRTFVGSVAGHRHEALFVVALSTGLRQGELLALKWSDLDQDKGTFSVTRALQRGPGQDRFGPPKSDRANRTVFVTERAATALRAHKLRQNQERLLAGSRWQDHGLIFASRVGTPLDHRNVTRSFQDALEAAGLPKKRFHDLRHTVASMLLAEGTQPRTVMEVLGHSQISLTMNTYSHVIPGLKRDAARSLDKVFTGAG